MIEPIDRDELVELMSRDASIADTTDWERLQSIRLTVTHQENAALLASSMRAARNRS